MSRGAENHYRCLSVEDIERFPLPPLADDCLLVLWRVASMAEEAYRVCRAWGFVPKAEIVWVKLTEPMRAEMNPHLWFGMGHYTRASHEVAIIGRRGKFKVDDRSVRSVFLAPASKRNHSQKPVEMYHACERLCAAGPRYELFARSRREGWTQFGLECPGRPAAPPGRP